jgi:CubicO group peptidase (beta-lactamase class C family)
MKTHHVPGCAVVVFDAGEAVWNKCYGVTDAERGRPIELNTLFPIACAAQFVTALTALQLAKRGELDLDCDVNEILREWKLPAHRWQSSAHVTVARLLSHKAGINVQGFPGYMNGEPLPSVLQILDGLRPAKNPPIRVNACPGERYVFSSGGFMIVQQVLRELAGAPFPDLVNRLVLSPLGMTRTVYEPVPIAWKRDAARSHRDNGQPIPGGWLNAPELAASGLWSTPEDIARLLRAIRTLYSGQDIAGICPDLLPELLSRRDGTHGLGCLFQGEGRDFRLTSEGTHAGHICLAILYPALGKGMVFMANGGHSTELAMEVVRSVARAYGWPDLRAQEVDGLDVNSDVVSEVAGEYAAKGVRIRIRGAGGRLLCRVGDAEETELFPATESEFVLEDGRTLTVTLKTNGHADALRLGKGIHVHRMDSETRNLAGA